MMGSPWPLMVLLILCVLHSILLPVSRSCFPEERAALMDIHTSLVRANSTPGEPPPPPWGAAGNNDCCLWERVTCSNATRRVSHLDLGWVHYEPIDPSMVWSLDTTIFAAFHELQFLDLSGNGQLALLSFDGFKNLSNLRELDLSYNRISGNLPAFLFSLPHIEVLNLSDNVFEGPIPINSSSNLTLSLRSLRLSDNNLSGRFSFLWLKNLSNLVEIDLSWNDVTVNVPGWVPRFQLKHLYLSGCNLDKGLLSFDGFKNLSNLRELDLSDNSLSGNLPAFLFSLPHIEVLDLSGNMFEGPIPIKSSSNLSLSLRSLQLSDNNLSGRFSFLWLKNLSNLVEIDLSRNADLHVTVNVPGWVPRFQLQQLYLSGCNLDKGVITKPKFLATQHHLEHLDLSGNNFSVGMPNWLFTKGSTLRYLNLANNSLTGSLGPMWYPQTYLQTTDISMNHISGRIPANISSVFPSLHNLYLSDNNFSGEIPMSLCHIKNISWIAMSNNNFSGELPACVFNGDLPHLSLLSVSNNHLGGPILGGRSNLISSLKQVHLDGNKFEGALPRNLSGEQLWIMDLHDNKLTGELDASSWNLSCLEILDVSGNYMTGEIQPELCALPMIRYLDLSNNHFTGPIRSCNSTSLVSLNLSRNSLLGDVSWEHFNTSILFNLDIRHNILTGNLSWVHPFPVIEVLSLGHNEFHGKIPPSLCKLRYLKIIDLSHNKLSGRVPPCIGAISFQNSSLFYKSGMDSLMVFRDVEGLFGFDTKGMQLMYGTNIVLMSGIDLSNNSLSGEIPLELGNLSHVKSLNLSRNALVGPIPASLANMSEVESLDLSHNELTGVIPLELTQLRSLEVFSVAFNHLFGCVPRSGQFDTFGADSFEGNNLKMCTSSPPSLVPGPAPSRIEMMVDAGPYAAGAASFVLAFWATVAFCFCHSTGRQMVLKL